MTSLAHQLPAQAAEAEALEVRLEAVLRGLGSAIVALSGGVDSSLVAFAAGRALGAKALAVTGVSASLSTEERSEIEAFCAAAGIAHATVQTNEMSQPAYVANNPDRCFYCKSELFGQLAKVARERGYACVVDGTNFDDLQGHRPGRRAADAHGVRSPLVELRATKAQIRTLAKQLGLPNADRPSAPCLSSRVAYGVEVTPERLARVGAAEARMKELGFSAVRVRLHDHIARIEVPPQMLADVVEHAAAIVSEFRTLGFTYVTLDLAGLRSGSLLEVLQDAST